MIILYNDINLENDITILSNLGAYIILNSYQMRLQ